VLEGKTNAVRNYSTLGTMGEVPALAKRHGIRVTLGAWLDTDRARNERDVDQAIRLRRNTATSYASWSATRSCFAAISRAPILLRISGTCAPQPQRAQRDHPARHGYDATYIPQSYSRGVVPDNFLDFKKQRSR
jgi:hypothetical protein